MIIHITRHGQPAVGDLPPGTNHQYPPGDPVLSVLGRRQAAWLGEHLAEMGFQGPIFSSPYRRTLETAQIIAEIGRQPLIPEPALQEHVLREGTPEFEGLTVDEMRRLYPNVEPDAHVPHPWFAEGPETTEVEVKNRMRPLLEKLFGLAWEEALLVGHGASVHACIDLLVPGHMAARQARDPVVGWNCALTTVAGDGWENVSLVHDFEISHMPSECVTSNLTLYSIGEGGF